MSLPSLHQAVLRTVVYADIFNFPLTYQEISLYLIGERPASFKMVSSAITQLVRQGLLVQHPSTHQIALRGRSSLFLLRQSRSLTSEEKAKVGEAIGKWLGAIPGVESVYLTGAVSMHNATKDDDIDLMIITKHHWLWLTRLLVTVSLDLKKIRRKPKYKSHRSRQVKDKICPNLYLDSAHLSVPASKRNLYTAHEVIQAKLLFTRHPHLQSSFLLANHWIRTFLPNFPLSATSPEPPPSPSIWFTPLLKLTNSLSYQLQRLYMKPRHTNELVTVHMAYFHPRNTSQNVIRKYQLKLAKLGIRS